MQVQSQSRVGRKLQPGEQFPDLDQNNIHGKRVSVPDTEGRLTHIQFRRFAGCPVCNLHLQSFVARNRKVADAAIHEVVVFHSPDEELLLTKGGFRST